MKALFRPLVLVSALALTLGSAQAATDSTTFGVSAEVIDSCNVAATSMAFGQIDPIANVNTDQTATVTVTCSNGTAYSVGLDAGGATGATVTTRQMTSGVNTLDYALYSDSSRTSNWGVTAASDTVDGTGSGSAEALTVYGRVASGQQTAPVGSYADTVTVTVTY